MKTTLFLFLAIFSSTTFSASATYKVPVPIELEKFSEFKVNDLKIVQNKTLATISFSLPTDLVGASLPPVSFAGKIQQKKNLVLNGTYGTIRCNTPRLEKKSRCEVKYNAIYKEYLEILDPHIEANVAKMNLSPDMLKIKKDIWERFSGEPLGFLVISDPSLSL